MRRAFWGLLLVALVMNGVAAPARQPSKADKELLQQQSQLDKVRKRIAQEQREVEKKKKEERGLSGQLADLEKGVRRQAKLVEQLQLTQDALAAAIAENGRRIDSLDGSIDERRRAVTERTRQLYMRGKPREAELLARAAQRGISPASLYLWKELLDSDKRMVEGLKNSLERQQLERGQLALRQSENRQLQNEQLTAHRELERQRSQKQKSLAQVKNDRSRQEQLIREQQASQKALLAVIQKLEQARRKAEAERAKKGKAAPVAKAGAPTFARCWPVSGRVVAPFGLVKHQGMGTVTRNLGVEIAGREGSPVRAVADGEVAYVGPIQGQGLSLILTHGAQGYYSVYAHLDRVRVKNGQQVGSCQELARLVDVGSPYGVTLFFQLKQGLESLDPMLWLNGGKQGPG